MGPGNEYWSMLHVLLHHQYKGNKHFLLNSSSDVIISLQCFSLSMSSHLLASNNLARTSAVPYWSLVEKKRENCVDLKRLSGNDAVINLITATTKYRSWYYCSKCSFSVWVIETWQNMMIRPRLYPCSKCENDNFKVRKHFKNCHFSAVLKDSRWYWCALGWCLEQSFDVCVSRKFLMINCRCLLHMIMKAHENPFHIIFLLCKESGACFGGIRFSFCLGMLPIYCFRSYN